MKKFLTIAVIALSMIVFVACGGSKKEKTDPTTEPTSEEPTSEEPTSDEPTTEPTTEPTEPDEEDDGCTGISIDWSTLTMYQEGSFYYAGEDPMLYLEFYQEDNDNGFDAAEGTYDLGSEANSNYSTCTECVSVLKDYVADEDGYGSYEKRFFQKSGTLTVEKIDAEGEIKGTLAAKLIEVTVDSETYESTPVEGGACIEIETASFSSACEPQCDGKQCGNDGCGGTCGNCEGQACSADFQCVPFNCEKINVGEFDFVSEESLFGTYYYYDAYTTGKGIGSESVPDLLEIGFAVDELEKGTITLTGDTENISDAYVFLYEDWDVEEYTAASYYFQESGTLEFTEVKEGTLESKGKGSFRLVEIDTDYVPLAGGKCYEVENITWDTICVPQCDGKVCGDDGCGGICGNGCDEDTTCNAAQTACIPYECETITLSNDDADKTFNSTYKSYRTTYSPNTGDATLDDLFSMQLFYVDPVLGEHDLAGTNYKDDTGIFIFVWEDDQNKSYFQQKGKVNITAYDEATGAMTVSFSNLRVEEVTISSGTYESKPVAGGKCYEITDTTLTYTGEEE